MADVATAATSPSKAKIPAPTIEPTPSEAALATVMVAGVADPSRLPIAVTLPGGRTGSVHCEPADATG